MPRKSLAASAALALIAAGTACASDHPHAVPGEKLDSGLGSLPPYREWSKHPQLSRFVRKESPRPALARAGR